MKLINKYLIEFAEHMRVLRFILNRLRRYSKHYILYLLVLTISRGCVPFINIFLPKLIIDELLGQQNVGMLIQYILMIIVINLTLHLLNSAISRNLEAKDEFITREFRYSISQKVIDMDYEFIEKTEILDLKAKAERSLVEAGGIKSLLYYTTNIIAQIITLTGVVYILSELSIVVGFVIILIIACNMFLESRKNKKEYDFWSENTENNKYFSYLSSQVIRDYDAGKYVRIYDGCDFIMNRYRQFDSNSNKIFRRVADLTFRFDFATGMLKNIQLMVLYSYFALKVIMDNKFTVGSFIMCTSAAKVFEGSSTSLIYAITKIYYLCKCMKAYKEFMELESNMKKHNIQSVAISKECIIEIQNVSFRYPGANRFTLKNISLKLEKGKKYAIVGKNGAGKTTFIKLLMRLYDPEDGIIYLNNIDIKKYNYKEYLELFSAVFQDYKLLAFSIKENITIGNIIKSQKHQLLKVIKKSGLYERVKGLGKGIETSIYKHFDNEGILFSGGECQKMAIARALYKDSPIVILDEPTAALDPIAEHEIYLKFNELVHGKTTIYISHRLSSCKFCDHIFVLDKGKLIQQGSHYELIDKEGLYAEMFNAQASYYKSY